MTAQSSAKPVPASLDGILEELKRGSGDRHHATDDMARSAVDRISERRQVERAGRAA